MEKQQENRKWHWVFWGVYFLLNHLVFAENRLSPISVLINLVFTLHNAGTAYVTLDWWIPRYYRQQKYFRFIAITFLTIIFFAVLLGASLYPIFCTLEGGTLPFLDFLKAYSGPVFWSNFSGITALIIPYFVLQRMDMERRNQQLEKGKLEAELKFLKSQLHPHFLFNALNNIYFLIKKDPETAAEALAGFSNLLRFQLYDANNPKVPLAKEIEYLQQFAEIAQLRKGEGFRVNWQLPNQMNGIEIAPLLLMPLVENAFKHGSHKNGQIDINASLVESELQFQIRNTKELDKSQGINGFEQGGIGLKNIQKRLQLLYPNQHNFAIKHTENEFVVDLKVALN